MCDAGWEGVQCETRRCDPLCTAPRGQCANGTCVCAPGYKGIFCEERLCEHGCSKHGACVGGKCMCDAGWAGTDCSLMTCDALQLCHGYAHAARTIDARPRHRRPTSMVPAVHPPCRRPVC